LATLSVSSCPSELGCIIAPVTNVGLRPNLADNTNHLSPTLGYIIGFSPNVDGNIGLQGDVQHWVYNHPKQYVFTTLGYTQSGFLQHWVTPNLALYNIGLLGG
jgi:hypothetical protein